MDASIRFATNGLIEARDGDTYRGRGTTDDKGPALAAFYAWDGHLTTESSGGAIYAYDSGVTIDGRSSRRTGPPASRR